MTNLFRREQYERSVPLSLTPNTDDSGGLSRIFSKNNREIMALFFRTVLSSVRFFSGNFLANSKEVYQLSVVILRKLVASGPTK